MAERDGFGLEDVDRLAQRAVGTVSHLVGRALKLGGAVLILAIVAGVGGFLLGIAALSNGIETVWILLGGFFAALALSSVVTALLRLRAVARSTGELGNEIQTLLRGDHAVQRTVVETVESSEAHREDGVVVLSRQFFTWRGAIGNRIGDFGAIASAVTAVTSFPGLIALATLISFVFVGLSFLFLIALAL